MWLGSFNVLVHSIVFCMSLDIEWKHTISKLPLSLTQSCIATTANDTIYIFGGYTTNLVPSRRIYSFDPFTNTLQTLNLSTPTNEFICNQNAVYSAITNKIYIIGIYTNDTDDWISPYTFNYEFDPFTHEFTSISNALGDIQYPLRQSCIAISGTLILVYGGFSAHFRSTLFTYDIRTKQWTKKANSAEKIFNGACYASEDSFYSFGGWIYDQSSSVTGGVINAISRYDMEMDTWYDINTLSYYKWQMKAVAYNSMEDTVLIIGGYGLTYERSNSFKIEAYNYKTDVVVSDVGTLSQTQGGSLMATSYTDGVMIFGGNSYWLQLPNTVPNSIYDDIYYSYLPTQYPATLVPTDAGETTSVNRSTPDTTWWENTTNTLAGTIDKRNPSHHDSFIQRMIANNGVMITIIVLGASCVLIACYLFCKLSHNRKLKHSTQEQNNNHRPQEVNKQRTVTLTPPGVGGISISIQKYINVNPNDGDDIDTISTDIDINVEDSGALEGVPSVPLMDAKEEESAQQDLLDNVLNEVLRQQSIRNDMMSDSEQMYVRDRRKQDADATSDSIDCELRNWLTLNGFDHYLDNFVLHGYDSLDFVKDIHEVHELIAIGVTRKADQHKLMSLIQLQLQNDGDDNMDHGNTVMEGENVEMHVQLTSR